MSENRPVAIFGDVHGESFKLRALLNKVILKYGPTDFYHVGDLIDRGPDSKGVIQTCIEFGIPGIQGNHEQWFQYYLETGNFDSQTCYSPMMGGIATLQSYGKGYGLDVRNSFVVERDLKKMVPEDHQKFILDLPLFRTITVAGTRYWLIHAGLKGPMGRDVLKEATRVAKNANLKMDDPDAVVVETIAAVNKDALLWDHYNPGDDMYPFANGDVQVFGHAPLVDPYDGGHFIALDTGCGRKRGTENRPNALSAVVLLPDGSREFVSVA